MPGLGDYLGLAGIVGNILALPKNIDDQAQADNAMRSLVSSMPGITPQQLDAIAPQGQSFPGADVPVLGGVLRGVGTVGQVLQGALGAPPAAPRPSLGTYLQLQALASQQGKNNATAELVGQFKNPMAQKLAKAGQMDAALKAEGIGGADGPTAENALIVEWNTIKDDPSNPRRAIVEASLRDIQNRKIERARVSGGISYGNAAAGRAQSDAIADTDRAEKRRRGLRFLEQQGITPPGGGNIIPQSGPTRRSPDGGFTLIADESMGGGDAAGAPAQPPLQRRGVTMDSEGGASVNFGLPDPVDNDMALLARSSNIDIRNPTPEQSTFLLKAKEGLTQARAAAARDTERLPTEDRAVITGLRTMQYLLNRSLTEFSPEERAQYIGVLRNPALRAKQFVSPDPRFAEFMALLAQIEAGKFDIAGKALTKGESDVVDKYIPLATETGGVVDFDQKAREYLKSSQFRVDERLKMLGSVRDTRQAIQAEPVPGAGLSTTPSGRKFKVLP